MRLLSQKRKPVQTLTLKRRQRVQIVDPLKMRQVQIVVSLRTQNGKEHSMVIRSPYHSWFRSDPDLNAQNRI